MSINVLVGEPGAGKSFFATMLALDYMRYGHDIFTNIDLNLTGDLAPLARQYSRVTRREEILNKRKGIIMLDEGQIWFNSRNWDTLTEEQQYMFQQHRKHDLHVWLITQNALRLDPIIRELIHLYARPTKVFQIRSMFKHDQKYGLQLPFVPSFGLGIQGDPDYAKFRLDVWTRSDITTGTMTPRLIPAGEGQYEELQPRLTMKAWLTPRRKEIWNTRQIVK